MDEVDLEQEVNRLQRVIAKQQREGLNHNKNREQFITSLNEVEVKLKYSQEENLEKQRRLDQMANENLSQQQQVHQKDLIIQSLEGKLSSFAKTWFNPDNEGESDRIKLQQTLIKLDVVKEKKRMIKGENKQLKEHNNQLQYNNQKLRESVTQLTENSKIKQVSQQTNYFDTNALIANFESIKSQFNAQVIDLTLKLDFQKEELDRERLRFTQLLEVMEQEKAQLEIQVIQVQHQYEIKRNEFIIADRHLSELREANIQQSKQWSAQEEEMIKLLNQRNKIIEQKSSEILKLQQDLNNSGSFLVDTINSIFPNHLEDYLLLKKEHLMLQKKIQLLQEEHKKVEQELQMYRQEINSKIPIIEQRKKDHDSLFSNFQLLKSKLENSIQTNNTLIEQIKTLNKKSQQDSLMLSIHEQQCAKQATEMGHLHLIIKKLKQLVTSQFNGDISAYNVDVIKSAHLNSEDLRDLNNIENLINDKMQLELDLKRLTSESQSQTLLDQHTQLLLQCEQLREKVLQKDQKIQEMNQSFQNSEKEINNLRSLNENFTFRLASEDENGSITGKKGLSNYTKEIKKIERDSKKKEHTILELKQTQKDLRETKSLLNQTQYQLEQTQHELNLQTETNMSLQNMISQIDEHTHQQNQKMNQLQEKLQQSQHSYLELKIKHDSLQQQYQQTTTQFQYQETSYLILKEEKGNLYRQLLGQEKNNEEVKFQLKQAISQCIELKKDNNDHITNMVKLQRDLSQQQTDKSLQIEKQLESQAIVIQTLEDQLKSQQQYIIEVQARLETQTKKDDENLLKQMTAFIQSLQNSESSQPSQSSINMINMGSHQFNNLEELRTYFEQMETSIRSQKEQYQNMVSKINSIISQLKHNSKNERDNLERQVQDQDKAIRHWKQLYEKEVLDKEQKISNISALSKEETEQVVYDLQTSQRKIERLEKQLDIKIKQQESLKLAEDEINKKKQTLAELEKALEQRILRYSQDQEQSLARIKNLEMSIRSCEYIPIRQIQELRLELQEEQKMVSKLIEEKGQQIHTEHVSNDTYVEKEIEELKYNISDLVTTIDQKNQEIRQNHVEIQTYREKLIYMELEQGLQVKDNKQAEIEDLQYQLRLQLDQHQKERKIFQNQIDGLKTLREGLQLEDAIKIKHLIEEGKMLEYLETAKSIFENAQTHNNYIE